MVLHWRLLDLLDRLKIFIRKYTTSNVVLDNILQSFIIFRLKQRIEYLLWEAFQMLHQSEQKRCINHAYSGIAFLVG